MDPDIIQGFVKAIELKDRSTAAHTWRVVLYARALAEAFDLDHELVAKISTAAALHDLGKIDIPDHILVKPGKLTDEEFVIIKTHTTLGHDRLLRLGEQCPVMLNLVRHHHERWDGRGYPDGLSGEAIPPGARYFAVIDSFDAMTSIRPYRTEIGEEAAHRAIVELESGMGTRYFPEAVEAFANLFRTGALDWIMHYFNDENPAPVFTGLANLPDHDFPPTG